MDATHWLNRSAGDSYRLSNHGGHYPLPGILGNIGSAFTTETTNFLMQEKIKEVEEKNSESKN
ncbi:hypothetical protein OSB94_12970 [Proteus vulgaris]|uniref:hypothetical protein n=1 Tax=Proteus vulgaris TaxID=585 RepID=UPI001B392461|nr:hypothetical protein [Proteus vulgaris]MBQ0215523.1 hypothetical protein [Proteus vulgaris]MDS0789007.1 hypothetical protein [Proteus vulgaris]